MTGFASRALTALGALALLLAGAARAADAPKTYVLEATPTTVAWGNYDAAHAPVLTIRSGDTVVFHTLITSSPTALEKGGVKPAEVQQSLRDIYAQVTDKGPGGHILTGPEAIEGAEPGDTLEVHIEKVDLAVPYAYNAFRYGVGFMTEEFPYARFKLIPLDREKMLAHFAPGIDIPLHPFFGSMGVAPPPSFGRYDSTAPTVNGGNMDNKELVAGTTLYLPVHAKGALFEIGDGHAGQGNGEADITAMETSLVGTVRFVLRKDIHVKYPRAETPSHYISMGFDDDLSIAAHKAVREMIDFLVETKGMTRDDAYMLVSVSGDMDITEVVDRNKGVHVMLPKAIFTGR
ncbi:MAG: acetamidase/formamidase family protein [Proteobacteria bacterium]|nr:acetamidase/formamidase family protein [Pseudomonadota bacterium]